MQPVRHGFAIRLLVLTLAAGCAALFPPRAVAQEAADPWQMFEQFFGAHTEADQEQLERIEITVDEERAYGQQAFEHFAAVLRGKDIKLISRGPEVRHLLRLVAKIQPHMKNADRYKRIKVYVADSPETDARSFPGGTLVIFRGMLEFAESEAALVGVLGHELSHLDHGHQLRYPRLMKMAGSGWQGQGGQPDWREMMSNGMFLARSMARPFRPEDETQADEDGAPWAFRAGYDPMDMARLFQRMAQRDGRATRTIPEFVRSHPYHDSRFQAIVQLSDQLKREAEK